MFKMQATSMTIPPVVVSDSSVCFGGYWEEKEEMLPVSVSLEGGKEEEEDFILAAAPVN